MPYPIILAIGFLAQIFFSARILIQWILSERAKKVTSPSIFWILSIAGSYLLCLYGWLKDDFAIILGQFISYYIYLWNLKIKNIWQNIPFLFQAILFLTPAIACCFMLKHPDTFIFQFFHNKDIPLWMIIFGSSGQIIFTLRFIYQWAYSYHKHQSVLPVGFWIISLTGSTLIILYGIMRSDPVLIIGQAFGTVAYARNIYIWNRSQIISNNEK